MAIAAQHLSTLNEHYTAGYLADASRRVLGEIDLDPASCELANRTVQAKRFYSKADDGLTKPWAGRVFLNPPGGRLGPISFQKKWWRKLAADYAAGHVPSAVYLGFNIQILQTSQVGAGPGVLLPVDFPLCIPSRRLCFHHQAEDGRLVMGVAPAHASVFVYLPPRRAGVESLRQSWRPEDLARFTSVFGAFGAVFGAGL